MHYRGTLEDGSMFDFSRDPKRNELYQGVKQEDMPPVRFTLNKDTALIEGFKDAFYKMNKGSTIKTTIPPSKGYAGRG